MDGSKTCRIDYKVSYIKKKRSRATTTPNQHSQASAEYDDNDHASKKRKVCVVQAFEVNFRQLPPSWKPKRKNDRQSDQCRTSRTSCNIGGATNRPALASNDTVSSIWTASTFLLTPTTSLHGIPHARMVRRRLYNLQKSGFARYEDESFIGTRSQNQPRRCLHKGAQSSTTTSTHFPTSPTTNILKTDPLARLRQ